MKLLLAHLILYSLFDSTSQLCFHGGKNYTENQEWVSKGAFRNKCVFKNQRWNVALLNCITQGGKEIAPNTAFDDGEIIYECKTKYTSPLAATIFAKNESVRAKKSDGTKAETGGGTLGAPAGGIGGGAGGKTAEEFMCVDGRGGKHEIGTYWLSNNIFNQTCNSKGEVETTECITPLGYHIPVGHTLVIDKEKFDCRQCDRYTVELSVSTGCSDTHGNFHYIGERWVEDFNVLVYCDENNKVKRMNCTCFPQPPQLGTIYNDQTGLEVGKVAPIPAPHKIAEITHLPPKGKEVTKARPAAEKEAKMPPPTKAKEAPKPPPTKKEKVTKPPPPEYEVDDAKDFLSDEAGDS